MSYQDVQNFYVEPDDDEPIDPYEEYYSPCWICGEWGHDSDHCPYEDCSQEVAEAEKKEGTADCLHLYMQPNYENNWHCYACGWTEGKTNETD